MFAACTLKCPLQNQLNNEYTEESFNAMLLWPVIQQLFVKQGTEAINQK